jgi:DNA-binding NarL/FixJ family response regulator
VCHEEPFVRLGIKTALEREVDCAIAGEADDARQALLLARSEHPDVVVVHVSLPPNDGGIAVMRQLARSGARSTPVLVLAMGDSLDEDRILDIIASGARGFVRSDAPVHRLIESVRVVAAGNGVLTPTATRKLVEWLAARLPLSAPAHTSVSGLSSREHEVLQLLAGGLSGREMSRQLAVTEATVRSHVHHILVKLGARDRAQAIVYAYRTGILYLGHLRDPSGVDGMS